MSAYSTARPVDSSSDARRRSQGHSPAATRVSDVAAINGPLRPVCAGEQKGVGVLELVIAEVAQRVAAAVVARLGVTRPEPLPDWLDSRQAAEYLSVHRDTLRKLAAERAIPAEQDGRGCKLFFRRSDLDEWRRVGGRTAHLSAQLAAAAA